MIFVIGGGLEKKLSLYDRREILWAQKVRSDWVIFCDRNTQVYSDRGKVK